MVKRSEKVKTVAVSAKFHRLLDGKRIYGDRNFEATLKRLMGIKDDRTVGAR